MGTQREGLPSQRGWVRAGFLEEVCLNWDLRDELVVTR